MPTLFLSHSGIDTEEARALKRRILDSPAAQESGLTVWFDKDDLLSGRDWQEQLEAAISREATAFAIYVGSRGVINWEEREVRLGLVRATGDGAIPFIPILAQELPAAALAALPAFAQQHHGVIDPLHDPTELAKLIAAALGHGRSRPTRLTDEPFVGLRAMTEREADRFFGRETEVAELLEDLRRNRLVAIVADSGSGKSSLAMAGLAPAFRGGALADPARRGPDDLLWHVVVMRPGGDPLEGLRRGVTEAAERMGLPADTRAGLRRRLSLDDVAEAAYALRCDLPAAATETLLIVDQFDELLTETPEAGRVPFIDALLALAAMPSPGGFHVVLTVRVDYFNLCRPYNALYVALQSDSSVLRLKRMSDAGLESAVRTPLRMADFTDEDEQRTLAATIRRDLSDRPGDLALAQMALWTAWRNRRYHGGSLLNAYVAIGGVSGALAQEAERIRLDKLTEAERHLLPALFVRLVRLGETGGVLRRIATLDELDPPRRALAGKLAGDDHGRLLMVGAARGEAVRVEVCHEALITQWPWLQNTLNAAATDVRALERLMDRAGRWTATDEARRADHLATGAERALFADLAARRDPWLAPAEMAFVTAGEQAYRGETQRRQRERTVTRWLAALSFLAAVGLGIFAWVANVQSQKAQDQRQKADEQRNRADENLRVAKHVANEVVFAILKKLQDAPSARIPDIQNILGAVEDTINDLVTKAQDDNDLQRIRRAMYLSMADVYLKHRDPKDAEKGAHTALDLFVKAQEPGDLQAWRDIAVSHEKIGDAAVLLQHRDSGLRSYEESLQVRRKLAEDLGHSAPQRDLSDILKKIGGTALQSGDRERSRAAYNESLDVLRRVAAQHPDDVTQSDVATSAMQIGDAALAGNDVEEAQKVYAEGFEIRRLLATQDSNKPELRRDVATAWIKVGNAALESHDLAGAREAYERSLEILRILGADDLNYVNDLRSVATGLRELGEAALAGGDAVRAHAAYDEALEILHKLSERVGRNELADVLGDAANTSLYNRDFQKALAESNEAISNAPSKIWVLVNKAHALMMLQRTDEARTLYLACRAQPTGLNRSWDDSLLQDFTKLQNAGITDPLMQDIRGILAQRPAESKCR